MAHLQGMAGDQGSSSDQDFPIVCETCLGDNPFIRMTKERWGKACKICDRAFTIYRWRAGTGGRYKKTEVCPTCAKMKNVCQTCILDLQYGLPVQVRDSGLAEHERMKVPTSTANRDYVMQEYEAAIQNGANPFDHQLAIGYGAAGKDQSSMLSRLQRRTPYYKRNRAHICSFWVRGECNRGASCPFRHEHPPTGADDPLAKQNIKDRYYGTNDPVAEKMMKRHREWKGGQGGEEKKKELPTPPEDTTITTLFVGGVEQGLSEKHISEYFSQWGEMGSVTILAAKKCAFVRFVKRGDAETAMKNAWECCIIRGSRMRVDWGKVRPSSAASSFPAPPGMAQAKAPQAAAPMPRVAGVSQADMNKYAPNFAPPPPPPQFPGPLPPGMMAPGPPPPGYPQRGPAMYASMQPHFAAARSNR